MRGVHHARLCEQVVRAKHQLIAQARSELNRWRKAARTARRSVWIRSTEDGLAVLARRCRVRQQRGIVGDQGRRIRLLAAVPGRAALGGQALGEHRDDRSLYPADPVIRPVGVEADIPEEAGIEERYLSVFPVFLVERSVPLQSVVEEL